MIDIWYVLYSVGCQRVVLFLHVVIYISYFSIEYNNCSIIRFCIGYVWDNRLEASKREPNSQRLSSKIRRTLHLGHSFHLPIS